MMGVGTTKCYVKEETRNARKLTESEIKKAWEALIMKQLLSKQIKKIPKLNSTGARAKQIRVKLGEIFKSSYMVAQDLPRREDELTNGDGI